MDELLKTYVVEAYTARDEISLGAVALALTLARCLMLGDELVDTISDLEKLYKDNQSEIDYLDEASNWVRSNKSNLEKRFTG